MNSKDLRPTRVATDRQTSETSSSEPLSAMLRRMLSSTVERTGIAAEVLETYRAYLLLIANRELSSDLRTIVAASDLVQESLIEAQQSIEKFAGENEGQLLAWLRRILLNNLTDAARRHGKAVERTVSIDQADSDNTSAEGLLQHLPDDLTSPSQHVAAAEEWSRMIEALDRLPDDLRQVVRLRNFELLTFDEIGRRLGRDAGTVCRNWYKAIERLQRELGGQL